MGDFPEVERGGVRLCGRRWGTGPPVLALHGLADHGGVWAPVASALSGFSVLAPDLRGHGRSGKPPAGYGTGELIADLEALLDAADLDRVHVMAHSWSAKAAVCWAARRPDRVRSLTLVDPFFIGRMPGVARLTFPVLFRVLPFLQLGGPFPSLDAAEVRAGRLKQYRGLSAVQREVLRDALEEGPDGQWRGRFARHALVELFTEVMRVDALDREVAVPTLLVLPEGGLNRFTWQLAPYRRRIGRLAEVQVPGHHWSFLTEPGPVAEAVARFLGEVEQPRAGTGPPPARASTLHEPDAAQSSSHRSEYVDKQEEQPTKRR